MKLKGNNTAVRNVCAKIERVYGIYSEKVDEITEKLCIRQCYMPLFKPLMENAALTQLELVHMTGLKAPTVSISIRNMEAEGFVVRHKSVNDRREVHVEITEKGKALYSEFLNSVNKLNEQMFSGISADSVRAAIEMYEQMEKNLKKV